MKIQDELNAEYKAILRHLDNGEKLPCSGLPQPTGSGPEGSQGPPGVRCGACGGPVRPMLFMGVQPDGCVCPKCNLYLSDDGKPLATLI